VTATEVHRLPPDREGRPVVQVALQALRFHPRNIRTNLGNLDELAQSIREEGVLVPLMAERRDSGALRLLHGHRRWAAADMVGLRRVPTMIVPCHTDDQAILLMLAENTARAEVTASDLQAAIETLVGEFGYSPRMVARRLGVPPTVIATWRAGRPTWPDWVATRAAPKPGAAPRKPVPSIRPKRVHELLGRVDAGELDPAAAVAELRAWMGDWQPAPPAAKPPTVSTPDCVEPDWAAVEAVVSGRLRAVDVGPSERRAAVREMTRRGLSSAAVADRVGLSQRQVVRLRGATP
jgi:ParB/RepB/Spo0J family partition protein